MDRVSKDVPWSGRTKERARTTVCRTLLTNKRMDFVLCAKHAEAIGKDIEKEVGWMAS